jgi:soluble lytic murein transglycosylase
MNSEYMLSFLDTVYMESSKYNYDWRLILAIIRTESCFDAKAESTKGALGMMQLMPNTAEWVSSKVGLKYKDYTALYDPIYNIKLGTLYLNMLHKKFGNMEKAIAAYNRGPLGLKRYLEQGREFPSEYLKRVMEYYEELKGKTNESAS